MSFGYIGFNNFNRYGICNYNMFANHCNPFARMAVANLVYNPFMIFNTAKQLMEGKFPNLNMNYGMNNYYYQPMSYYTQTIPYASFAPIGDYYMPQGSLYDNLYYSQSYASQYFPMNYNVQPTVVTTNNDFVSTNDTWHNLGLELTSRVDVEPSSTEVKTQPKAKKSSSSVSVPETMLAGPAESVQKTVKKYQPIYEQIAGAHLNKDFLNKTKQVAQNIGCDYEDLLAVMNSESTLNPQSVHKNKRGEVTAVGLIQFTKNYAIVDLNRNFGLNLTVEKIQKMSAIEQLDLVQKYYEMNKNKLPQDRKITAADLYAVTYLPARASKEVLTVRGEDYYNDNRGLDVNYDGKITKDDLEQRLSQKRVKLSTFA